MSTLKTTMTLRLNECLKPNLPLNDIGRILTQGL